MGGGFPPRESGWQAVSDLMCAFRSRNETDWVPPEVIGPICKAVGAHFGSLLVPAQETDALVADAFWCKDTLVPVAVSYPLEGDSKFSRILQTRRTELWHSADSGNDLFQELPNLTIDSGPVLMAPVLVQDEVAIVILLGRLEEDEEFTSSEILIAEALASVVSLGFCNGSLNREIAALTSKLARADAQLLQSAKLAATGKLAASIAHEINNPLQAVQSCIYLVADGIATTGPSKQYLDIAREELDRIAKIVHRLADLYRPAQEGRGETDLNGLLQNVMALMSKRLQQGNIRVIEELEPDLTPVVVVADQIKQVSFNLILNAVEAMPEGGTLEIGTRLVQESSVTEVEIRFKDSGVGITPEAIDRVFDPFYTTKAKGTGLGLSISHDIIERHGGSIRVESTVGRGSAFTVRLPTTPSESGAHR